MNFANQLWTREAEFLKASVGRYAAFHEECSHCAVATKRMILDFLEQIHRVGFRPIFLSSPCMARGMARADVLPDSPCLRRLSVNLERGDCFHHAAADALIGLAGTGCDLVMSEAERFADDDGNLRETQAARTLRKRMVGSEYSHGQNGSKSLCDDESDAGAGRLKVSIPRSRSLWEEHNPISSADFLDDLAQGRHITAITLNGNYVHRGKQRTEKRPFQQVLPREI